jgi:hypothetical protein
MMNKSDNCCHGCPKHQFGCRTNCPDWQKHEETQQAKEIAKNQKRAATDTYFSERKKMVKEYYAGQKLKPRSASNYY